LPWATSGRFFDAGTVEWYDGNCKKTVYNAGDAGTEGSQLHYVSNVGTVNAHFM
jgi:hypothetical protein